MLSEPGHLVVTVSESELVCKGANGCSRWISPLSSELFQAVLIQLLGLLDHPQDYSYSRTLIQPHLQGSPNHLSRLSPCLLPSQSVSIGATVISSPRFNQPQC